jgi:XisH protein
MAKDVFHDTVRIALEKDGWTITHDPFPLKNREQKINYEIDLGAEKILIAEKGTEKIAVEVKSFLKASFANEFHSVLGQYLIYIRGLKKIEPERILFLAMPIFAYKKLKEHPLILEIINELKIHLIIFDESNQLIESWIK